MGRNWTWPAALLATGATAWTAYRLLTGRRSWALGSKGAGTVTPEDTGFRHEPWDIGTGVTGYAWHAPEPRAVVLLQHGFGEYAERSVTQYNQLIPRLLASGVSVYAFDMWGHGHSPGVRGLVDVRKAVEDHLAARQVLQEQPLPVFLFGHSLGGLVTATSVLRDQSGVQGVMLSAGALLYEEPKLMHVGTKAGAFLVPTMPVLSQKIEPARLYRGAREDGTYQDDPLIYHGAPRILVASTTLELSTRNWDRYGEWHVPVLAIHGTEDIVTDPRGSERLIDTVVSKDRTLHLVQGGYHELLNDVERDATLRMVLDWLAERIPGSSA